MIRKMTPVTMSLGKQWVFKVSYRGSEDHSLVVDTSALR
jgi:hypothetical protein